jgi:hypothetical protein
MLFSRGMLVSNVDFSKLADDTFMGKQVDMDQIRTFYHSKSLPLTEKELANVFHRLGGSNDPEKGIRRQRPSMPSSGQSFNAGSGNKFLLGLSQRFDSIKKSLTSELEDVPHPIRQRSFLRSCSNLSLGSEVTVESAALFSEIDRVETLKGNAIKKYIRNPLKRQDYDEDHIRQCSFAIFIRGSISKPLILSCTTPDEVKEWMEAFRVCIGEQKSMVLGSRKRGSVSRASAIFGINNPQRFGESKAVSSFIDWDEDEDD